MSAFDRFQKRQHDYLKAEQNLNTQFIFNGYPSIKISRDGAEEGEDPLQAVVVNKQEKDEAYIYTPWESPLQIGSTWNAKGLHFLIAEEIVIVKDTNWHKYYCYLCNIEDNGRWWFFYSPKKKAINFALKHNVFLESAQKPVLVTGGFPLNFRDKFMAGNRAWIVDEYDNLASAGITYYTLSQTTMSKDAAGDIATTIVEKADNPLKGLLSDNPSEESSGLISYLEPGKATSISTEDGYVKFSDPSAVKILRRNATQVVFQLNYNVESVDVSRKIGGKIIMSTYATKKE